MNLHNASSPSIHRFLQLPQVVVQGRQRRSKEEPLVDYSKSISEQYLQSMEAKAEKKKKAKKEYELRKLEVEKKESRAVEKVQKEAEKAQRKVDIAGREAFK